MPDNIQIAIGTTFWDAYIELPKAQQKKLNRFLTKFREEPTSSGINYERINALNPAYRSVRIDQAYRCIVLMP